jgi:alkyl hydroperoxide reductase subunit F
MIDLAILGGGPAGLAATAYALRKRLETRLISEDLGGKTNLTLELPDTELHSVISAPEVVDRFRRQIEYLEFPHLLDRVARVALVDHGFAVTTARGTQIQAKALILATGAYGRRLNVPGEEQYLMRGLCASATSYAPLFLDRRVVVIGDGPRALRAAAELALNAAEVTLVSSEPVDPESPLARKLGRAPNVVRLEGYSVRAVKGDQYARSLVVAGAGEERELDIDAAFVEHELLGCSHYVDYLVDRDEHGRIVVDAANRTSRPGIFAAGDVTTVPAEQVLVALGEGAKAALTAYEYLLQEWD